MLVYSPKKIADVEQIDGNQYFMDRWGIEKGVVVLIAYSDVGENVPLGVNVTYEDGTKESITIYVTKK